VAKGGWLDEIFATQAGSTEQLFRALVEQVPAVVYVETNEFNSRTLYLSPQVGWMFGRAPDEWIADPDLWWDCTHPDDRALVDAEWAECLRTGDPFALDYRIVAPDGTAIWTRDTAVPIHDERGETVYWEGVMYDITASKTAEDELRASEARYRALIENTPAVVYMVAPDDDRKTLYVSPQVEVALGYSRREWLEQPDIWMELLHPDDREQTLAAHDLHNETGRPWSREYRLIASDGRPIWFRDVATLVRDPEGRPLHWQGVQLDITELKRAEDELRDARDELELRVLERTRELEEANELMMLEIDERRRVERQLRETQERFRMLAERIPGVTYVWRIRQKRDEPVYVSPQVEAILGYRAEEWGSADLWVERLHPDDRDAVLAATRRSATTGEPFSMECRYLAKDGRVVWVVDEAILVERDEVGRPKVFHGVMVDVTARREAEAKAVETELRYRTLAAQIPAITYLWSRSDDDPPYGGTTYVSPQVETVLGFTPEQWTSQPDFWITRLHPADRDRVLAAAGQGLETGQPFSWQYRLLAADGRVVWIRDEARVITHDDRGRPVEWQGIMLDVTEHERAQLDRRSAEARLRAVVEQVPAIVYAETAPTRDERAQLVYISPQVEAILGYQPDELIGDVESLAALVHPDDRDRVVAANDAALRDGAAFDEEYRVFAKDGRVVWFHSRASPVSPGDDEGVYWQGVALDVTDRHQLNDAVRDFEARTGAEPGARTAR